MESALHCKASKAADSDFLCGEKYYVQGDKLRLIWPPGFQGILAVFLLLVEERPG